MNCGGSSCSVAVLSSIYKCNATVDEGRDGRKVVVEEEKGAWLARVVVDGREKERKEIFGGGKDFYPRPPEQ